CDRSAIHDPRINTSGRPKYSKSLYPSAVTDRRLVDKHQKTAAESRLTPVSKG
ncbi:hypothetical protein HAX54_024729, partial [Datura stramonium]|nr:hypothetical protein [Datura stramonium]